jgi:hypothetical protein
MLAGSRSFAKCLMKAKNGSMTVTRSEDRDETKYTSSNEVTFGVGRNHSFAGELGRAVKRGLHRKERVPEGRHQRNLGIYRTGRGKGDLTHTISTQCFEPLNVAMVFCSRPSCGWASPNARCTTRHAPRIASVNLRASRTVSLGKGKIPMLSCRGDKLRHAGAEIVVTHNNFASAQQPVHQIASGKFRRARYERGQGKASMKRDV